MARPRKTNSELRDDQIKIRLTIAERAIIEENADALGVAAVDYVRQTALGKRIRRRDTPFDKAVGDAIFRLSGIWYAMNQIAKHLNEGSAGPVDYDELAKLMKEIAAKIDVLDDLRAPDDADDSGEDAAYWAKDDPTNPENMK